LNGTNIEYSNYHSTKHQPLKQNIMDFKNLSRIALGTMLLAAGTAHLSFARKDFQAQVPDWVPLDKDDTVIYSGIVEILLGAGIVLTPEKHRKLVGLIAAGFFVAVFPGNIAQYLNHRDAFTLDTDAKRFARLFMQPVLVAWAILSTQKNKRLN